MNAAEHRHEQESLEDDELEQERRYRMDESAQRAAFAKKWTGIQKVCGKLPKDSTNPHFKYKYTSEQAMKAAIGPALSDAGFAVYPSFEILSHENDMATVRMELRVVDSATGWTETFDGIGSGQDKQDKAIMKATTAAWKVAMTAALSIARGEDPDADGPMKPKRKAAAKSAPNAKLISDDQRKRLWTILGANVDGQLGDAEGKSDTREAVLRQILAECDIESTKDITTVQYDGICDRAEKFDLAELGAEQQEF